MPASIKVIPAAASGYNNVGADYINEIAAGGGVSVDTSSGGRGTLLKDGGVGLENAAWVYSRNAANNAEKNLIRLDSNDRTEFDSTQLAWRDWSGSAAFDASGSMTVTGVLGKAIYWRDLGSLVLLDFAFNPTLGGVASDTVRMTLPVVSGRSSRTMCYVFPSIGSARVGICTISGSYLLIFQPDFSNWSLGAKECQGQILYSK